MSIDPTAAVYVISVAAELSGMHPQTLRIYERKGLVAPARTNGGSRRYSDEDIQQLRRISELTESGMNLAGVHRVLELELENQRLRAEIERLRAAAESAVEHTHRQYRRELVPSQPVDRAAPIGQKAVAPSGLSLRCLTMGHG